MSYADLFLQAWQGDPDTAERARVELVERFPMYPLNYPGMPIPGSNFRQTSMALGDPDIQVTGAGRAVRMTQYGTRLDYLYRRALYDPSFGMALYEGGQPIPVATVPGHLFGANPMELGYVGPRPAKVMVVGKHPGVDEIRERRNFIGAAARPLIDAFATVGIYEEEWLAWYATNVIRWNPPTSRDTIPKSWLQDCRMLLEQELRLVRPDYVLCLGVEASRAMSGSAGNLTDMLGKIFTQRVQIDEDGDGSPIYHEYKVMPVFHPAYVSRRPELTDEFHSQMSQFARLTAGVDPYLPEDDLRRDYIYTSEHLARVIKDIKNDPNPMRRILATDCEWNGEHPEDEDAYLRTIQFSNEEKYAAVVVLRHQGGAPAFFPSIDCAIGQLRELFKTDVSTGWKPRVSGWFLRADLPWLNHAGLDVRDEYDIDSSDPRNSGGVEASLAYHAVRETGPFGLESVAARLTTAPRYDLELEKFKRGWCAKHRKGITGFPGYGMLPDRLIHEYGAYDADVSYRIIMRLIENGGLLDRDDYGNNCWLPYMVSHGASLAFLEMEGNGISVDRSRLHALTVLFMDVTQRKIAELRAAINWPEFNPSSPEQCVEFLFGDRYLKKPPRRPQGATVLNLHPIKATGKKPKLWSAIEREGTEAQHNPSTDKEVLGIVGQQAPLAMQLRDIKFLSQLLRTTLRPPDVSRASGHFEVDEDGEFIYEKGLASYIRPTGRIHTRLSQHKETGRASSSKPNLQAISKRREDDYARLLGELYTGAVRTIFRASPGHVLIEADLQTAEVAVLAWLSGDPQMIEDVRRTALPEDHPDYFDIHSNMAVTAFHLTCAPTKAGLKSIGKKSLRVAAKNVVFGIPYGRGDEAIARQCREEGNDISVDEAAQIKVAYHTRYPRVEPLLEMCRSRASDPGWVCTAEGRYRRFRPAPDRATQGEQERQSQNIPIQGTVADEVSKACRNFQQIRKLNPHLQFRMLLQIHDALLFEVPIEQAVYFKNVVLPHCMRDMCPVYPRKPDGTLRPDAQPHYFGIDTEVFINWGQPITEEIASQYNLPAELWSH